MSKSKTTSPVQEESPVAVEASASEPVARPEATPKSTPKSTPKAKPKSARAKPAAATAPAANGDTPKAPKAAKPKLVRDSFTIPKDEYQVLDLLKARALSHGKPVKKSELLRAGIRALDAMSDRSFLNALKAVPTLKTGRPKAADQA